MGADGMEAQQGGGMSDSFQRIVTMSPAFDKRHPDPNKNYGIGGVALRMVLKGSLGAVQFVLYTSWLLPHVQVEFDAKPLGQFPYLHHKPTPADLGYHWHAPRYEGQGQMACEYVEGGHCYYDGSSLNAQRIYDVLLSDGSDGVWRELESYYSDLAKDAP